MGPNAQHLLRIRETHEMSRIGGARPGAGRPPRFPGEQMWFVNLKLPRRVVDEMDRIKEEQGLKSRTDVILWLLDELPNNL